MNQFFLTNIIDEQEGNKISIIKILQARGFFIDYYNDKYYLSDNADIRDIEFLSEGLHQFHIGNVLDKKDYMIRRRLAWDSEHFLKRTYTYEAIKPITVEIVIDGLHS